MVRLGGAVLMLLALTACHGDCYNVREAEASGQFGDTTVAVAGAQNQPGTVRLQLVENAGIDKDVPFRYLGLRAIPLSSTDSTTLFRLTPFSDKARTPLFEKNVEFHGSYTTGADLQLFDKLFAKLAEEDLLFEVGLKNGTTAKARLKVEKQNDTYKFCERWT